MKNGYTMLLSDAKKRKLASQRKKMKLKDMAELYGLSFQCMSNVLKDGRCSQRIYKQIFNEEK